MSGPGLDHVAVGVSGGDLFVARWESGPPVRGITAVTKYLPTMPCARRELVDGTNYCTLVMGADAPVVADRILEAVH